MELFLTHDATFLYVTNLLARQEATAPAVQCVRPIAMGSFIFITQSVMSMQSFQISVISHKSITEQKAGC